MPVIRNLVIVLLLVLPVGTQAVEPVRVAVASNVIGAMEQVVARFEARTDYSVVLSSGSTGKHYAQIRHGAPFDVFFAADSARPARLEAQGMVVAGTRATYARGRLVLWSPDPDRIAAGGKVLRRGDFRYLALANPRLAPYGLAARQVLERQGLWDSLEGRRVMGENIAQTFQFVRSGNAALGFVALSQLAAPGREIGGSRWLVPERLHDPIEQQAVLLSDDAAPRAFLQFVLGRAGQAILRDYGYEVP